MRKLKLPGREKDQPRLDQNDVRLIKQLGIDDVKQHAEQIVEDKLMQEEADPKIPDAGNPIYKAMHACNATSREKLFMSHRIRPDHELTDSQVNSVVDMLMRWTVREYNFYQEEEKEKQIRLGDFFMKSSGQ